MVCAFNIQENKENHCKVRGFCSREKLRKGFNMNKIAYERPFLNVFPGTETRNFTIVFLVFLVAKTCQELSTGFVGFPGFQDINLANTLHQDK